MNTNVNAFQAHISNPPSRAAFACRDGEISCQLANVLEAGKFFPATEGGLKDPHAPNDEPNNMPPADGKIASANVKGAEILDKPGPYRPQKPVSSGRNLSITWTFSAAPKTRRWNYFMTKQGWDSSQVLSRASFEKEPFATFELKDSKELTPENPIIHTITMPERTGYQVLLGVWEAANTGNACYQVVDLGFDE